jgi:hypothetical protein
MFWNLDVLGLDVLGLDVLILDVLGYHQTFWSTGKK